MTRNILNPAIALANRLSYARKFALLWMLSMIAVLVVVYSLLVSINQTIRHSQQQLDGLVLIRSMSKAIQHTQQHRGFSSMLLGGNELVRDRRAAKAREVVAILNTMEGELSSGRVTHKDFLRIKTDWERLHKEGLHLTMEENFTAHTRLIKQMRLFFTAIADKHGLNTESEIGTFYLTDTIVNKLPDALEHFGQIRGFSTGIIVRKKIDAQQRIRLESTIAELDSAIEELMYNLEKTGYYNPAIRGQVSSASLGIAHSAQQITNLLREDVFTGRFATRSDAFLGAATIAIDKSYLQMYETLLPTAESLIMERITRARTTLRINIGIAFLLFLVVAYLSFGIYYAVTDSIESFADSTRKFADGNLNARVRLDTHDEIRQIGDNFNKMADSFNAMLESQRENEARLHSTLETAMDAVVQINASGIITGWNKQAEKIFGWSREDALGRLLDETIVPPQHRKAHRQGMARFLASGKGSILNSLVRITGIYRDGREFPIELSIASFRVSGKQEFSAFIRDITERERAEAALQNNARELEQANARIEEERAQLAERVMERTEQLLQANRAKDSFLATMSHEIRTPLGGMLGMMELISLSRLDAEQREMLQAARESGQNLLRIVNDILDWSKIEAGKLELSPQITSIPEMIKGVIHTYSPLASAKGLVLSQWIDSRLPAAHILDPLRLAQILNNFTSNAIKFTEHGTVEINVEHVAQSGSNEEVRFCVRDSGIGINKEQQARLFQRYEQAGSDTARMYGGTGLGLTICQSLVEMMAGTLSVESTPGQGSTFCFTVSLPIASPAEQRDLQLRQARMGIEHSGDETPATTAQLAEDARRVLVVDDHPINRILLKQQLEQLGLHAEVAEYGIVALALWQTGHFDLMITDCHMPEMDGYELTRSIRKIEQQDNRQRMPIIAWTANVFAEEEGYCRAAGMDDILTKPANLADLRTILSKWLDGQPGAGAPTPEAIPAKAAPDKSPADTPIDFGVLKKIVSGSAAQVEMLQEFNLHNRDDIFNLDAALKDGDPAAVARLAHRIKGASRMVGALELDGICTAIERISMQGDMEGARAAAAPLGAAVERLEAAIGTFIGGQQTDA